MKRRVDSHLGPEREARAGEENQPPPATKNPQQQQQQQQQHRTERQGKPALSCGYLGQRGNVKTECRKGGVKTTGRAVALRSHHTSSGVQSCRVQGRLTPELGFFLSRRSTGHECVLHSFFKIQELNSLSLLNVFIYSYVCVCLACAHVWRAEDS